MLRQQSSRRPLRHNNDLRGFCKEGHPEKKSVRIVPVDEREVSRIMLERRMGFSKDGSVDSRFYQHLLKQNACRPMLLQALMKSFLIQKNRSLSASTISLALDCPSIAS